MTTNETRWFRDGYPFSILQDHILPDLLNKKSGRIRIWSSAASTGQEPFSIAMVIMEFCRKNPSVSPSQFEILATDISSAVIETARKGEYDFYDFLRGLPESYFPKYFDKNGNTWKVKEEIKKMILFRTFNLKRPFEVHGKFDVIFCRNVMIYFSLNVKRELMEKFNYSLKSHGCFFLGLSESICGITSVFESVRHEKGVFYKKRMSSIG